MRALQPKTPELTIDWSRPVIKFDPWPFHGYAIEVKNVYLLDSDGTFDGPHSTETLTENSWDVLGYASDGKPFLTREDYL